MSSSHWEGGGALWLLCRLNWRARRRGWRKVLRQPRKLAALLLAAAVIAFFVWGRSLGDGSGRIGGQSGSVVVPLILAFFVVTSVIGSIANGTLAFSAAEAQFLLPGPIGTRALVVSQLLAGFGKSLVGAAFFALFLTPAGMSFGRGLAGYGLLFAFLILLGSAVDLSHALVRRDVRRRRARRLGFGVLGAAVLVVAATCALEGPWHPRTGASLAQVTELPELLARDAGGDEVEATYASVHALQHLTWPGRPLVGILRNGPLEEALLDHAIVLVLGAGLLSWQLRRARGVREAASETSQYVATRIERARKGRIQLDRTARTSSGRVLPMLPRLGGAGPHCWRQLSILVRQRRAYVTLVSIALLMGVINWFVTDGNVPVVGGTVLGWIAFMGPFYVQCDFRSDYDSLAWLRSLPCSPTALAAGQVMASALVLTALELFLAGWVLVLPDIARRDIWLVAFAAVPFANVLQLAVENGAWLLFPVRSQGDRATPGAMHVGRMYALMLAKLVIVGVATVPWVLGGLLGGPLGALAAGVTTGLALCVLALKVLGRIFARVDPATDLNG